ncbi:MAG TPA: hypothetical protein ENL08_05930 [Bacteroidetes bacterium]|nr:hypothetical protein [Bacteroidota bacterium]
MIIAVTIWNNRISPVFDVARDLLMVDLDDGGDTSRRILSLAGMSPQLKIESLKKSNVEMVLCGAISESFLRLLTTNGIRVEPWISGDIEEVIQALLQNRLSDPCYCMPGCNRFRRKGGRHRGSKRHRGK